MKQRQWSCPRCAVNWWIAPAFDRLDLIRTTLERGGPVAVGDVEGRIALLEDKGRLISGDTRLLTTAMAQGAERRVMAMMTAGVHLSSTWVSYRGEDRRGGSWHELGVPMSVRRVASLKPDPDERTRRRSVEDDVARLVLAFERNSIDLPADVAYAAWQLYSEELCAGWLVDRFGQMHPAGSAEIHWFIAKARTRPLRSDH